MAGPELSSQDLDRLRESYGEIARDPKTAGLLFYDHLFRIAPDTRDLFLTDIEDMAPRIMNTLGLMVAHIQSGEGLEDMLTDLSLRHVAYGVKPAHYNAVGEAIMAMLKDVIGAGFDAEIEAIWLTTYRAVSERMIEIGYST